MGKCGSARQMNANERLSGATEVEWKARFYRGYPKNDPPAELNDDIAIAAVTTLQRAYLAALKAKVEEK